MSDTAAASSDTVFQRDLMDVLRSLVGRSAELEATPPPRRGISRSLLPSFGYSPNAGLSVGVSLGLGGWLGDPADTRLSSAILGASYSTQGQTSVLFRSSFVLPRNAWVLLGDWRYLNTNQPTFGLGPTTPDQSEYPMKFILYRVHEVVARRLKASSVSVGFGYHFDQYEKIRDRRADAGEATPYTEYSAGYPSRSRSSGISVNMVLDTRDNQINARQGMYVDVSVRTFQPVLGSDFQRDAVWLEFRSYRRLPRASRHVLAVWGYLWLMSGTAPYLDLPATGWDKFGRGGRGYVQGRMRGAHQVYAEAEYRVRLTQDDLIGMVAFANLTGTSLAEGAIETPLDLGFGVGVRCKLSKRTDSNVSIDIGRGDDRATHIYFALNEAY